MLKKYHVIINKIETIEHEFEAENIKELKEYLKNLMRINQKNLFFR